MQEVIDRCTDYLSGGGLFNPELANHDAVRDLIIECRDIILIQQQIIINQTKDTEVLAARMNRYQYALQEIWDIADQCDEPVSREIANNVLTNPKGLKYEQAYPRTC